jgi:hypothetical protein
MLRARIYRNSPLSGALTLEGSFSELTPFVNQLWDTFNDDLSTAEQQALGDEYWKLGFYDCLNKPDWSAAYQIIFMATLGEDATKGYDGLSRPHVNGKPLGLLCSREATKKMVDELYEAMLELKLVEAVRPCENIPTESTNFSICGMRIHDAIIRIGTPQARQSGMRALRIAQAVPRIRVEVPEREVA